MDAAKLYADALTWKRGKLKLGSPQQDEDGARADLTEDGKKFGEIRLRYHDDSDTLEVALIHTGAHMGEGITTDWNSQALMPALQKHGVKYAAARAFSGAMTVCEHNGWKPSPPGGIPNMTLAVADWEPPASK